MKLEIESDLAAAYVRLGDRSRHAAHTVPLTGRNEAAEVPALRDLVLDFNADGRLIGLGILDPGRWLPRDLVDEAGRRPHR